MNTRHIVATLIALLVAMGTAYSQDSGVLLLKSFLPGSANLDDPTIDRAALAKLDSLMQDDGLEFTFLGAADSLRWKIHGKQVRRQVSETLDDARRLGRARALRERYGRGTIGISDESFAGVVVIWQRARGTNGYHTEIERLRQQNNDLNQELVDIRDSVHELRQRAGQNGISEVYLEKRSNFDWQLQAGMWNWRLSNTDLLTPALSVSFIIGKTAMVLRGGVTPWSYPTDNGHESESFVYLGLKYVKSERYGLSAGAFRGWRFFTESDNWSLKTTGAAVGVNVNYAFLEFNPMLTYSKLNTFTDESSTLFGSILNVNVNIN